jgi:hypothetical protein
MTPAQRRMARLQKWNLERLPALTEQMFRAVLERADRECTELYARLSEDDDARELDNAERYRDAVSDGRRFT